MVAGAVGQTQAVKQTHTITEWKREGWQHPSKQPRGHSPWEALGCWPMAWPSWSESHSCMRMKGSRPFCVSLLHGFGRDSMSLTLPWDKPSTWGWVGQEGWVGRPLGHRPSPPLSPQDP